MSILPVTVACLYFLGADPATPDEIQRAVTCLERSLQPPKSLEVRFREYYTAPHLKKRADLKQIPLSSLIHTWSKPDHMFTVGSLVDDPATVLSQEVYDGQTTRSWYYDRGTRKLDRININSGQQPRSDLRGLANLGILLGIGESSGLLRAALAAARETQSLSGTVTPQGLELALGTHEFNHAKYDIWVTVDPTHDCRMTSWRMSALDPANPHETFHTIDEFQSVKDEATNSDVWFPRQARTEIQTKGGARLPLVKIEVDLVRINPEIPDAKFVHQEPPVGTAITDFSNDPTGRGRRSTVGGPAEEQKQSEARQLAIALNQARLDQEGTIFDATPPSDTTAKYWAAATAVLWLVAGVVWWFRRRRAATA